jgi:hypothetical protein
MEAGLKWLRNKPQVSVGGLLEKDILGKFWESHRENYMTFFDKEQYAW